MAEAPPKLNITMLVQDITLRDLFILAVISNTTLPSAWRTNAEAAEDVSRFVDELMKRRPSP